MVVWLHLDQMNMERGDKTAKFLLAQVYLNAQGFTWGISIMKQP
jgi:hypothetical protein